MQEENQYIPFFPHFIIYSHYSIKNELKPQAILLEHIKTKEKTIWLFQHKEKKFQLIFKEEDKTILLNLTNNEKNSLKRNTFTIEEIFFSDKIDFNLLKNALKENYLSHTQNKLFEIKILPIDIDPTATMLLSAGFLAPITYKDSTKKIVSADNTYKPITLLFNKTKRISKKQKKYEKKSIYFEKINLKNTNNEILSNIKEITTLFVPNESCFQGFHTETFEKYLIQKNNHLLIKRSYDNNFVLEIWHNVFASRINPEKKEKITFFLKNKENNLQGFLDGFLSKNKTKFFIKNSSESKIMLPFIKLFLKEKYQNFKTINIKIKNTSSIETEK